MSPTHTATLVAGSPVDLTPNDFDSFDSWNANSFGSGGFVLLESGSRLNFNNVVKVDAK